MSEFKGTPGPWFVYDSTIKHSKKEGQHSGTFDIINREQYEIGMKVIADAKPYGGNFPDREEAYANAKLIAASPDLLLACTEAQKHLRDKGYGPLDTVYACLINAIAKATT